MEIMLQLHGGGGGGGGTTVKTSAPGSKAAATVDTATDDERQKLREQLAGAKGRRFTDKTGGGIAEEIKKRLLGE